MVKCRYPDTSGSKTNKLVKEYLSSTCLILWHFFNSFKRVELGTLAQYKMLFYTMKLLLFSIEYGVL